ncbi:MAG: nitroreductase family protein [Bacteroidales bacterium OttesenSCG-928-I14]|jgi:nitroreductase|nr:nitroreductase family protein [Bacteroidales bacterium OttesenSCG-928-I14]
MNHFTELILKRRSIREYNTEEKISHSVIKQIMETALMAPTSKNSQAWQFILIEDKMMLKNISACKSHGAAFISKCNLAVIVLIDPLCSEAHIEDATIAATYIQLQSENLNLGSCWVHIRERKTTNNYDSEQYIKDLLNIPSHLCVECIISIGNKIKEIKHHKKMEIQWEKVHNGKW